jgi:pimeloyl-ACP methyl ester carboxylesterase
MTAFRTPFLDVRALAGGGDLSSQVQTMATSDGKDYFPLNVNELQDFIHGKDVLIGTHGFNVNRAQGIECLSDWGALLVPAPFPGAFVGLLWPGDSESLHALAYPVAPRNATAAGNMIAKFVDEKFGDAASISLVSHSLGARVLLQTASQMNRRVRRAILMAGAVGDHCLSREFAEVPPKVDEISVLASKEDEVLRWAFPIGDLASEIVDHTHPWWESALGRFGPSPTPDRYLPPCQIPKGWKYGHGSYLQTQPPAPGTIPPPTNVQKDGPEPLGGVDGWQEAFSASFASTRFQ